MAGLPEAQESAVLSPKHSTLQRLGQNLGICLAQWELFLLLALGEKARLAQQRLHVSHQLGQLAFEEKAESNMRQSKS